MKPPIRYCAVYTRKSTEEGLEQDFNSLDAQREAGLAYIASQKAEGWVPVLDAYDDGGYSGGNLERPALKRLLEDIKAGKVNTVVVYKIDRLTRALMDFSKLVEIFDQYGVTFVSITQSFNTTTSMGRLTLNVLLSFAQFEREVIGERVRDKIAASKKKGMWMGGIIPLGYRVENRQLIPEASEVEVVRHIFDRYLVIRNVNYLQQELQRDQVCSKVRVLKDGRKVGGVPFSRGALRAFLSNPVYIGQIRHRDKVYEGQHEGVLPAEIWQKAQDVLKSQATIEPGAKQNSEPSLLKGLIADKFGTPYSPGYSYNGKRQYRYYISQNVIQQRPHTETLPRRFPAYEIESLIEGEVRRHLSQRTLILDILKIEEADNLTALELICQCHKIIPFADIARSALTRVTVHESSIQIHIKVKGLLEVISQHICRVIEPPVELDQERIIDLPYTTWRHKKGSIVLVPETTPSDIFDLPQDKLKKLVQGVIWRDEHFNGMTLKDIAQREGYSEGYVGTSIFMSLDLLSKPQPVKSL